MRHTRHYTLSQALDARAWVALRLRAARRARRTLEAFGPGLQVGMLALDQQSGGSYPSSRELAEPLVSLSLAIADLESIEVVLRDVDGGLVDFPAIRDGHEVYLCWRLGEDDIRYWHPIDSGLAGRRLL